MINRPPKNGEHSEKNHDKNCDSTPTTKTERKRTGNGETRGKQKRAKMSGKHSLKTLFEAPPPGGGQGGVCAVCGGEEASEWQAPAGGYGGITKPPARVATVRAR